MNTFLLTWSSPPGTLVINSGELHVWRADLDSVEAHLEKLRPFLSQNEVERANRFYFSKDRDRFILSHAFCRSVLSRYLDIKPERLPIIQNSFGKPALQSGPVSFNLQFNLTHSGRFALVAVTKDLLVGVDVEFIRQDFDGLEIARRFFSSKEYQALISLPDDQQSEAFFRCWTRKEAYLKARGTGLSTPLDEFDVSVHPVEPAEISNIRTAPGEVDRWSMIQADPAPGYSGTAVVQGRCSKICYWDWFPADDVLQTAPHQLTRSGL